MEPWSGGWGTGFQHSEVLGSRPLGLDPALHPSKVN